MSFGSKSLPNPTKAQSARHDAIRAGDCVPCLLRGIQTKFPQVNHLLSGGIRIGHDATVGECYWHHMGGLMRAESHQWHREYYGPSRAEGSKPFHREFGSDAELLAIQNELLGIR